MPEPDLPPQPGNSRAQSAGSVTVVLSPTRTLVNFASNGVSTGVEATMCCIRRSSTAQEGHELGRKAFLEARSVMIRPSWAALET